MERHARQNSFAWLLSFAIVLVTAMLVGALSNWFRYGLSLEGMFALAPLIISAPIAVLLMLLSLRSARRGQLVMGTAVFALGVGFVTAHREAFGSPFPSTRVAHVETSGVAVLHTTAGPIRYRLELHNPFAESHRELLVVEKPGSTQEFELPIFDGDVGGYASANQPGDWVIMRATSDPRVFEVRVGPGLIIEKTFRVNFETGTVSEARMPPNSALHRTLNRVA